MATPRGRIDGRLPGPPSSGVPSSVPDFLRSSENWLIPEITTHVGFLLALVFLAYVIKQRRSPSSTLAWLLLVLFLPYVGVPLYLMFGGRKMKRMAQRKARVYDRGFPRPTGQADRDIDRFLLSYGVPPASGGNAIELLTHGEDAYRRLVEIIDGAEHTIHVTTYILGRGPVGAELVRRLAARAADGVSVRLLLDSVGSWRIGRQFLAPLIAAGARVAFFMPVLHIPFRGRANLRNHRKIMVVDSRIAVTGGMNLAWPYLGPGPDPELWRDLSAVVRGPAVADLEWLFLSDWAFATREEISLREPDLADRKRPVEEPVSAAAARDASLVQVVASGPDVADDPLYESLVSLIFAARRRIWIVTPYFIPDEMLIRALNLASRRGVDVRLIVPAHSNHISADLARGGYLHELHDAGGQVLFFEGTMLHAKAVVFDDSLAVIGSANMDNRSLFLNYEVALFLYSQHEVAQVVHWMEDLHLDCRRDLPRPGWAKELLQNMVRLISPLL